MKMEKFEKNIDNLISRILKEEIDNRAKELTQLFGEGEWKEIEMDEELHGNQHKIDVAEPKGKITAKDFEELRKEEVDEDEVEDAEEASELEPTYVGKGLMDNKIKADLTNKFFGSFNDEHGWFDNIDSPYSGEFDFDYDEEEFTDFESLMNKYGKKQRWFAPEDGKKYFDKYQEKFGGAPFRVRSMKSLEEETETEEGNAFTDKLRKTPKGGKFTLGGKTYKDTSNIDEAEKEKWIQKTDMKKGALHKKLGVPEGEKISVAKLKKLKSELAKKAEGKKKLSPEDRKLSKQVNLAMTLKDIKENTNKLRFTENELIDFIEKLVIEQKVKEKETKVKDKAEKTNISKKESQGMKETEKVLGKDKKENEDNLKAVEKKMKEYLKTGSKAKFEMDPKDFPKGNGELDEKMTKKSYKASDAVDEYIENFAYPGLENTKFDEIKPNEDWLTDNLVGSSRTGNNPEWANAVKTDVGEKVNKKRKANLYQKEKDRSYNRVAQPVDEAGEGDGEKSLDNMFAKLESVEDKGKNKINEEMEKMKSLISYNKKTQ
jgi:hypothetical protein